jgi:hypothetical protein
LLQSVAAVVCGTLELPFRTHVRAFDARVGESRVQIVALAIGHDHGLGKNPDGRFARNTAWLAHFGDASFDCGACGNYGLSVDNHGLADAAAEGIAGLIAERRESGIETNHQRCARGNWSIRLCGEHGRQQRAGQ